MGKFSNDPNCGFQRLCNELYIKEKELDLYFTAWDQNFDNSYFDGNITVDFVKG